jgi:hypothetical protein
LGAVLALMFAKTNIIFRATNVVKLARQGYKDLNSALSEDEKQKLSLKLGWVLVREGLVFFFVFALALLLCVIPIFYLSNTGFVQAAYWAVMIASFVFFQSRANRRK